MGVSCLQIPYKWNKYPEFWFTNRFALYINLAVVIFLSEQKAPSSISIEAFYNNLLNVLENNSKKYMEKQWTQTLGLLKN